MTVNAAGLRAEVGFKDVGANAGLDQFSKKVEGAAKKGDSLALSNHAAAHSLKILGTAAIAAGAVLGAAFIGVNASAAEFNSTMSGVKAVSGATGEEMKTLSALALQLGKDTVFSAKEAGQGIEELIKGGISIGDVAGGAAAAALNLATAGAVPLTVAAEQMSDAMNIFALKGTDAAHAADLIAGAANASSMTVTDFGFALKMTGAVAKLSGQDFDSTATAIAVMAEHGLKGSDAGTSLKQMLISLQPNTKAATQAFLDLGLITKDGTNLFIDAQGKYKTMAEISQILKEHTQGLTDAQKVNALQTAFGTDAIRAAAIMAEAGAEGYAKMTAEMSKVTALDVARERLNNLKGDMEQFRGSAETAAILFGDLFTPNLREMTKGITEMVNGAIDGAQGFAAMVKSLEDTEGISHTDALLATFSANLKVNFGPETALLFEGVTNAVASTMEMFGRLFKATAEGGPSWVENIATFTNMVGRALDLAMEALANWIVGIALLPRRVGDALGGLGTIIDGATGGAMTAASNLGNQIIVGIITGVAEKWTGLITLLKGLFSALPEGVQNFLGAVPGQIDKAGDSVAALLTQVIGVREQAAKATADLASAAVDTGGGADVAAAIDTSLDAAAAAIATSGDAKVVKPTSDLFGVKMPKAAKEHIEKAKPEVKSAIDGFMSAMEVSVSDHEATFGKKGGAVADALAIALRDGTESSGLAVGRAMEKMISDAQEAGVTDWRDFGDALAGALHDSLIAGVDADLSEVSALLQQLDVMTADAKAQTKEAAAAAKEAERLARLPKPGEGFLNAVTEVARSDELVKQFGVAGASAVEAFGAAWDGDHNAEAKAGNAIQRMIGEARKVGMADANTTGGAIIDTLAMALSNGDAGLRDIGLAALADFSARLEQAKKDVESTKDAIKQFVADGMDAMNELQGKQKDRIDFDRDRARIDLELQRKQAEIRAKGGAGMGAALSEAGRTASLARIDIDTKERQALEDRDRTRLNDAAKRTERERLSAAAKIAFAPAGGPGGPSTAGILGPALAPVGQNVINQATLGGADTNPTQAQMDEAVRGLQKERPIEITIEIDGDQIEAVVTRQRTEKSRHRVLA